MNLELLKQNIYKYGFAALLVLSIFLYLMWDKRGRTIDKLRTDSAIKDIQIVISDAQKEVTKGTEAYEQAFKEYITLRNCSKSLLAKLGIQ